jgi:hypothetical protein
MTGFSERALQSCGLHNSGVVVDLGGKDGIRKEYHLQQNKDGQPCGSEQFYLCS